MSKNIVIDTNVFIRYLVKDNEKQFQFAKKIFKEVESKKTKAFVSILVINEIIWVLENYYEIKREDYLPKLITIFSLKNFQIIEITRKKLIEIFEMMLKKNIDFTDIYLLNSFSKEKIVSFDKDLR
ncbi:MAG: hypothetical protein KatS3mg092_0353 [Patescibacteria group bacterium]|nr:MAG: hypothetical protein KatS3mg092_0353 [Patescibacteria group bacterium]